MSSAKPANQAGQSKKQKAKAKAAKKDDLQQQVAALAKPIIKNALKSAGSSMGSMAGGMVGMPSLGRKAGGYLAAKLSKLIGSGDYETNDEVVANSLFPAARMRQSAATASFSTNKETVRVKHREYMEDVFAGATGFSIQGYPVNPGVSSTFQYLSSIAQNFEEYIFHGLVFEFVTTTSPYSTVPNVGSVIMAMQYDAAEPAFTSKPQMENSDFAVSAAPYKCIMYGVECVDNAQQAYYVRLDANANQPINLTDIGAFYVAVQNTGAYAAGTSLGELWVSYDVEFRRPHISPSRFGYAHAWYNGSTGLVTMPPVSSSTGNAANPGFVAVGSMLGCYTASQSSGAVTAVYFPNANVGDVYQITITLVTSADIANVSATPTFTGFEAFDLLCSTSTSHAAYGAAAPLTGGGDVALAVLFLRVTALGPFFAIANPNVTAVSNWGYDILAVDLGNGFSDTPPYVI